MSEGFVSVIIPTRNRAELLRRSITSVLGQTHETLELIVIDDGSTDHTRDVLAAVTDPRLRVISGEGRGAATARNAGIEAARGDLVAFQDDDDVWLLQKLERQLEALASQREKSWCVSHFVRVQPGCAKYVGFAHQETLDYSRGIEGDWSLISTPGWLVPRELLLRTGGFDPRIRSFDDWELGLRLNQISRPLIVREALWIQDRQSGGGLIWHERRRADDLRIAMEKHAGQWTMDATVMAMHWARIGRAMSLHDPAPSGRSELRRALRIQPMRLRAWAALIASYIGQPVNMHITQFIRHSLTSLNRRRLK